MRRMLSGLVVAVVLVAGAGVAAVAVPGPAVWTVEQPPGPPASHSGLSAVACAGPDSCFALGHRGVLEFETMSNVVIEHWDGFRWRVQPSPVVPRTALGALACSAPDQCVAVGIRYTDASYATTVAFAETWDGRRWTVAAVPSPGGAAALTSVACPQRNLCLAVGSASGAALGTVAEVWDGTSWTVDDLAVPPAWTHATSTDLSSVSCGTPTTCTAVGLARRSPFGEVVLTERWSAGTWTSYAGSEVPDDGRFVYFDAVSCWSASGCTAVGSYVHGTDHLIVETLVGTRWRRVPAPEPAIASHTILSSISCTSASSCVALGNLSDGTGRGLVDTWDGSSWTISSLPPPADSGGESVGAVTCLAGHGCTVVGTYGSTTQCCEHPLIVSRRGSEWRPVPGPDPKTTDSAGLLAVSCVTTDDCTAVGETTNRNGGQGTHAVHWDGASWTFERTPATPAGVGSASLTGVSCAAATSCVAVGTGGIRFLRDTALVDRWNGTRWVGLTIPHPNGSSDSLESVSCATPRACVAVGTWTTFGRGVTALIERWDGTAWTIDHPALPAGSEYVALHGVDCPSAKNCYAVGDYGTSDGRVGLVLHWDGSRWHEQQVRNPSSVHFIGLRSVSCGIDGFCAAAGLARDRTSGAVSPLVDTLAGSEWSAATLPRDGMELSDISCAAATSCVAVGYSGSLDYDSTTLVETWDGTTWTAGTTGTPPLTQAATFEGIDCPGPAGCTAVGRFVFGPASTHHSPLAARLVSQSAVAQP